MTMTQWELRRQALGRRRLRVLLCDDDRETLLCLHRALGAAFEKLGVTAELCVCTGPRDLPGELLDSWDMAFLDIDLEDPEGNGIDIARLLRQHNSRGLIFFVTNFIDYAPEGYEVQAFRYILKRDLEQVLERYLMQALEHFAEGGELLRLWGRDGSAELPLVQIRYLEVMDHSVSIHAGSTPYTLAATLSSLAEQLENHGFLRIHKSFLVNMRHIRKFRSRECLLSDGTALAVSERGYAQQKQKYLLWKGLK